MKRVLPLLLLMWLVGLVVLVTALAPRDKCALTSVDLGRPEVGIVFGFLRACSAHFLLCCLLTEYQPFFFFLIASLKSSSRGFYLLGSLLIPTSFIFFPSVGYLTDTAIHSPPPSSPNSSCM